jgi:type II secretory pathway pseudopilin PulG
MGGIQIAGKTQVAGFFVVSFLVIALIGILAAIAIPNVGVMIAKSVAEDRTLELYNVQTAVNDMLYQSVSRTLQSVGPTADMSKVRTTDIDPLVLSDYLQGVKIDTGCSYEFTADGVVVQVAPE